MTLTHAICEAAEVAGSVPDIVHLLPAGHIRGQDGRTFSLADATRVIAASRSATADLPIDYEHQSEDGKRTGGPAPAAGWIKELFARADGIWGRVEWTGNARGLIADRAYRYLSPVILHRKDGSVVRLIGAGLTHRPNLTLKALNRLEDRMTDDDHALKRIAETLGVKADTETIIAAINAQTAPDPARYVPIEAVRELMAERAATNHARDTAEAEWTVERAMEAGHLTPAMRDWAIALCSTQPATFQAFIAASPAPYRHIVEGRRTIASPPPAANGTGARPLAMSVCEQLGLTPDQLND